MAKVDFKYEVFNPNPYHVEGKKHTQGDCVIRALCKATGMGWFEVYDMLCAKGRELGDFGNKKSVYSTVLIELGWASVPLPRIKGKKAMTVESFIKEHPTGTYILRLAHHLTTIVDGICYDTWYPQSQTIYTYWTKK